MEKTLDEISRELEVGQHQIHQSIRELDGWADRIMSKIIDL